MKLTVKEELPDLTGQITIKPDGIYQKGDKQLTLDLSDTFSKLGRDSYPGLVKDDHTLDLIKFVELRGKSDYSMLDSMAKIDSIVAKSEVGAGIEDHGTGFGIYDFNQAMLAENKKAINGVELYLKTGDDQYDHLVVIAKNKNGYREVSNLISLASSRLTLADETDPLARPYNLLSDFDKMDTSNLIVLHGYFDSAINRAIHKKDLKTATDYIKNLKTIFNPEDVYLEVQYHNNDDEIETNEALIDLGTQTNTKLVLTNDYHMMDKNDLDALQVEQAIGLKKVVGDNTWHLYGDNWYFHTSEDVEQWKVDAKLTDATIEIFDKIESYDLHVADNYMPKFDLPEGFKTQNEYFEYLTKKGLEHRIGKNFPKEYQDRLDKELKIIEEMGFAGYFLVVADFINYAKRNYAAYDEETANRWKAFIKKGQFNPAPIAIGPARGSAAGSLVAYSMSITEVDPLKYDLLFERFLNPERVSMPDIDTDIPDDKRAELIEYVDDYYNAGNSTRLKSKVAGISVFGTLQIKGAIKAVVRGLYNDPLFGAKLANAAGDDAKTINEIYEYPAVKQLMEDDKRTSRVLDYAARLSGVVSNLSQHAAGYVIAPEAVTNYLPVTFAKSNKTNKMEMLTAYTHVEDNGLLKMDFLGLKAMTIINDAINSINKDLGKNINFNDILTKAPTDVNLFKFLKNGNLGDIFQLASSGMTDLIIKSLADVADDSGTRNKARQGTLFARLVAGIAMYRPGPMAYTGTFIDNALHPNDIEYVVPEMKDLLAGSFGLLIYQESIMALLQVIGGFTLGGADVARRTIGHKRPEDLPALKKLFIEGNGQDIPGGLKMGHNMDELEKLWGDIETFAQYGFNKSHAVGYAHISIVMTWLAYYYPAHYGAAVLNHSANTDDINRLIGVYQTRGVKILPASISNAEDKFTAEDGAIRFGLDGIRSVATKAPVIVKERHTNGKFTSFYNFLARMARNQSDKPLNKSSIEGLIYAGTLDEFFGSRKSKVNAIDKISQLFSLLKKEPHVIFDDTTEEYLNTYLQLNQAEMPQQELLDKEHYYTGFYISGHPTNIYKNELKHLSNYSKIADLKPNMEDVAVLAVITKVQKIMTKKNEVMAFLTVEDQSGNSEAILFPSDYADCGRFAKEGNVVIAYGTTQDDGRLVISSLELASDKIVSRFVDHFQIKLNNDPVIAKKQLDDILKESNHNNIGDVVDLTYVVGNREFSQTKTIDHLSISNDTATLKYIMDKLGRESFTIIWNSDAPDTSGIDQILDEDFGL